MPLKADDEGRMLTHFLAAGAETQEGAQRISTQRLFLSDFRSDLPGGDGALLGIGLTLRS